MSDEHEQLVPPAHRNQTDAIPAKDSFQSASVMSPGSGARHGANASDIVDSDSELEVPVQPEEQNFAQ